MDSLKDELKNLKCTTCSVECEQKIGHDCNQISGDDDKALCPVDLVKVLELIYKYAQRNHWCKEEVADWTGGTVTHKHLLKSDFGLED